MSTMQVLVCATCQAGKDEGNYCGKCGSKLQKVTVTLEPTSDVDDSSVGH